jgi:hypothetical protein
VSCPQKSTFHPSLIEQHWISLPSNFPHYSSHCVLCPASLSQLAFCYPLHDKVTDVYVTKLNNTEHLGVPCLFRLVIEECPAPQVQHNPGTRSLSAWQPLTSVCQVDTSACPRDMFSSHNSIPTFLCRKPICSNRCIQSFLSRCMRCQR